MKLICFSLSLCFKSAYSAAPEGNSELGPGSYNIASGFALKKKGGKEDDGRESREDDVERIRIQQEVIFQYQKRVEDLNIQQQEQEQEVQQMREQIQLVEQEKDIAVQEKMNVEKELVNSKQQFTADLTRLQSSLSSTEQALSSSHAEHQQTKAAYEIERAALVEERAGVEKEKKELGEKCDQLEQQYFTATESLQSQQSQFTRLLENFEGVESGMGIVEKEYKMIAEETKAECERAVQEKENLQAQVFSLLPLQSEVESLKQRLVESEQQIEQVLTAREALISENAVRMAEYESHHNELLDTRQDNQDLQSHLHNANAVNATLRIENETLRQECLKLEKEGDKQEELRQQLSTIKSRLFASEQVNLSLRSQLSAQAGIVEEYTKSKEVAEQQCVLAFERFHESVQTIDSQRSQLTVSHQQYTALHQQYTSLHAQFKHALEAQEKIKNDKMELKEVVKEKEEETIRLQCCITKLEDQLNILSRAADNANEALYEQKMLVQEEKER